VGQTLFAVKQILGLIILEIIHAYNYDIDRALALTIDQVTSFYVYSLNKQLQQAEFWIAMLGGSEDDKKDNKGDSRDTFGIKGFRGLDKQLIKNTLGFPEGDVEALKELLDNNNIRYDGYNVAAKEDLFRAVLCKKILKDRGKDARQRNI